MSLAIEQVREFHQKYGAAVRTVPDADVPEKEMRLALITEELLELAQALGFSPDYPVSFSQNVELGYEVPVDTIGVADALGDLLYVIYGAALTFGIDLDAVVVEIHRSNMSKLGADGLPIMRDDGKVLKGPNFSEPDLANVLGLRST